MPINKTADNAHAKYRIRVPMTYTKVLGITHSGHLGQISVSWGTEGRRFKSSQSDRGVSAVIENGLASFDHTG